jgi:hypothetical protein
MLKWGSRPRLPEVHPVVISNHGLARTSGSRRPLGRGGPGAAAGPAGMGFPRHFSAWLFSYLLGRELEAVPRLR